MRHNVLYRAIYNETGECCEDEPIAENDAIMMYAPMSKNGQGTTLLMYHLNSSVISI
ncbi:protein of unknown function [Paenibacillus alvei]|uniref:Uncharacterized protein n=1 Tax=Paenibacillus alvei TaxID=44250 RepID=A0A383REG9_PAEAL|nr:protein of unknown function [Paenibacillus alvei]